MRCRLLSCLLVSCLLLAACGTTTRMVPTNPSPRPLTPRPPESVEVFTAAPPRVPFVEVAIIQSRQSSKYSVEEMPEIIQSMREAAGQAGCDAILIHGASNKVETDVGGSGNALFADTHSLDGFWGACVVYLPEPEPADSVAAVAPPAPAVPAPAAPEAPAAEEAPEDTERPTRVP